MSEFLSRGNALRALTLAVFGVTVACCLGSFHPSPWGHDVALFAHLGSLVLGFGAVLSVDWVAILWILGRRDLNEVLDSAATVAVPIWIGYVGLVLSGLALAPNLDSPLTVTKIALVFLIGWNGLAASILTPALKRGSQRALMLSGMCALISQMGWWGATIIGFVNRT